MEERERLAKYACMYEGDWNRISLAIQKNDEIIDIDIKEKYITCLDPEYPEQFRALRYPPWVIFYRGDLSLLHTRMISIIGSRELTAYGEACTRMSADILKRECTIVSGLAKGADGIAHRCALNGGHTIGIIGSGFSCTYPYSNKDLYARMETTDLILSEYPYHTGVRKHHFPWRNRLIAALGEALIVTQAKVRSGTMLTVEEALALSKDVYAFAWPANEEYGEGCCKLIADGAMILYDKEQLFDIMRNRKY